jgi:hypothetical protein
MRTILAMVFVVACGNEPLGARPAPSDPSTPGADTANGASARPDAPNELTTCEPVSDCGCWTGCGRFTPLDAPADPPPFRGEDGRLWERRRTCANVEGREACQRVCVSDASDASCIDALAPSDESCRRSCLPSEAPFHCERAATGCARVEHPTRAAQLRAAPPQ